MRDRAADGPVLDGNAVAERDAVAAAYDLVRRAVADLASAQRAYTRTLDADTGNPARAARRSALDSWIEAFDELIGQQVALLAEIDALRLRVAAGRDRDGTVDAELAGRRSRLLDYLLAVREGRRLVEIYRTEHAAE